VDFSALSAEVGWQADAGIGCLGTTLRLAGSTEAFDRIERGYLITAATLALLFIGWIIYRVAMPHLIARLGG
jgi:hypothetical protein